MTVGLFRSPSSLRLPTHGHDEPHACLVLDGCLLERDGGGDRRVEPGSLRLSPAGDEHRIGFGSGGALCLLLMIDAEIASGMTGGRVRERVFRSAGHLAGDATELAAAMERDEPPAALMVECFATELIARASRRPPVPPPWLLRVRDRLREAPETVARLGDLAREANVHPGHLVRSFRDHFGCTPGAFHRTWRLERARRRVTGTTQPLSRIAYAAGFADQAHMTREFRRRLDTTPAALRRGAVPGT